MALDRFYAGFLERYGDRTALVDDRRELTYAALDERSARFANVLGSVGLGREDLVGILLGNRSEYVVAQLGAARAGVTAIPFNDRIDRSAIEPICRNAGLRTLVVGPDHFETARQLRNGPLEFNYLIGVTDESEPPLGFHRYRDMLSRVDADPPSPSIDPEDVAAVHYTGGTTGSPKGTLHTHHATILNMYAHVNELEVRHGTEMLLVTPLGHSAGKFMLAGLMQGGTIHLQQGFDSERILRTIDRNEITWTYLVPTMIARLLDDPAVDGHDLESLETLAYGSAPIPPAKLTDGIETLGDVFVQFYGLTEVPNLVAVLPKSKHDPENEAWLRSAGRRAQLAEVTIFEDETNWGDDVGEIGVRSPYAVAGYLNRSTLADGDDWIRTGDVGYVDDEGRLYVLDRIQDVITVDGEAVYSTEVERVVQRHPAISQVAIIGVPREPSDAHEALDRSAVEQRVKAIVVPAGDADLTVESVREFCAGELPERALPESIDTVGQLPETPYGKINKRLLREPYW
ncbi:AMP-binding protein [Natrinema sp. 1APR25-10V2]|uniref:AMP-binding protein n=1 Tax=Natrinema sp. 1APR25-10V2 TaxID=2951081 RepID=UPI0028767DA6|nr:AMP-binding protein [Natrinema sp. 1APR25-10V2]MDS0474429.1 AMP-binding protein [Natrinema sp. 1APR25-10V2]